MQQFRVLWVPGTDHAGIATQMVVERQLAKEGLDRRALGREAFIERVWEWRRESGDTILGQLRRLGCSLDWSRLRFTLDPALSRAVRHAFVLLYRDGLIYKGRYVVNWCPGCGTAVSDLEVVERKTRGTLYKIRYDVAGGCGGRGRGHDPARDDARRHGPGDPPGRSAQRRPAGQARRASDRGPRAAGGRRRDPRGPGVRHRDRQGHARPRRQRLRRGTAPRAARRRRHRPRRQDDGGGGGVRGARPLRGAQADRGSARAGGPPGGGRAVRASTSACASARTTSSSRTCRSSGS